MSKHLKLNQPTHDEIAACALRIYEMEGRPEGKAVEHWLQAEAQLIAERKAQAAEAAPKTAKSATSAKPRPSKARSTATDAWSAQSTAAQRVQHN